MSISNTIAFITSNSQVFIEKDYINSWNETL